MISLFSFRNCFYGDCVVLWLFGATIYRACVVDSLGLGITYVLYRSTMCTRHPDLVSFAIPIFHIII